MNHSNQQQEQHERIGINPLCKHHHTVRSGGHSIMRIPSLAITVLLTCCALLLCGWWMHDLFNGNNNIAYLTIISFSVALIFLNSQINLLFRTIREEVKLKDESVNNIIRILETYEENVIRINTNLKLIVLVMNTIASRKESGIKFTYTDPDEKDADMTLDELDAMLKDALSKEDYEMAKIIKERIDKKKSD